MRICSLVAVGARMWAGLHDGRIRVWEAAPGMLPVLLGDWQSHDMNVIGLAVAGMRVFSLGADGSIKAWAATTPCNGDADARRVITQACVAPLPLWFQGARTAKQCLRSWCTSHLPKWIFEQHAAGVCCDGADRSMLHRPG